jgi:hypothetical protein
MIGVFLFGMVFLAVLVGLICWLVAAVVRFDSLEHDWEHQWRYMRVDRKHLFRE